MAYMLGYIFFHRIKLRKTSCRNKKGLTNKSKVEYIKYLNIIITFKLSHTLYFNYNAIALFSILLAANR